MKYGCLLYALCGFGILLTLPQVRTFTPSSPSPLPSPQFFLVPGCGRSSDRAQRWNQRARQSLLGTALNTNRNSINECEAGPTILKPYEYDGWTLTYRTIADNDDDDDDDDDNDNIESSSVTETSNDHHNVLLIHPVGIGLASWFWEPLLEAIGRKNKSDSDVDSAAASRRTRNRNRTPTTLRAYAPNLIGCGISEGSDAWDPDQRGMFVPMGWVKGCEALMRQIESDDEDRDRDEIQPQTQTQSQPRTWTVVAQGGLAPIGVLLAARNPESVSALVLASPPTWKDMTEAVPRAELERNYEFLRSKVLGGLAFAILETRGLVEFFSNQFLFTQGVGCDAKWLDKTELEMCVEARPPVQNFNAGMCMNTGLGPELATLGGSTQSQSKSKSQSKQLMVTIVQGANDKRPRDEYEQNMENCRLVTIEGTTNVIPWEEPESLADLLADLVTEAYKSKQ